MITYSMLNTSHIHVIHDLHWSSPFANLKHQQKCPPSRLGDSVDGIHFCLTALDVVNIRLKFNAGSLLFRSVWIFPSGWIFEKLTNLTNAMGRGCFGENDKKDRKRWGHCHATR